MIFISADNGPGGHACMSIWRLLRGWNTPRLTVEYLLWGREGEVSMAEFNVKTSGLNQVEQSEKAIARELQSIEDDIRSIISNFDLNAKAAEQIKRKLRNSMQEVSTAEQKVQVLSNILNQVARLYQDAENRITGKKTKDGVNVTDGRTAGTAWTAAGAGMAGMIQGIGQRIEKVSASLREGTPISGLDSCTSFSSDPVNLSNGNYVYEKSFLKLDTIIPMEFRIFYNIQSEDVGILGRGWIHSYEVRLAFDEDRVGMVRDDGSLLSFLKGDGDVYYPLFGTFGSLAKTEQGYEVTDRDKFTYFFDKEGRWISRKDSFGNTLELSYEEKGEGFVLESVRDGHGNSYSFRYNADGKLESVSDHTGRQLCFRYEKEQVKEVTDPEGRTTGYVYDDSGWLAKLINGRDVACLQNTFDAKKRTVMQQFPDGGVVTYEYLDDLNQVKMTEQNGNVVIYERDNLYRNVRNIYENGEEKFTFNGNHQRTSFTDRNGNTSYYGYDENGNLTSFKNALEDELQYTYTDLNQVASVALNGTVLYKAVYNDRNLQESVEDALGARNTYEYDEAGQPVVWTMADGCRIEITYDEAGNMTSITNSMGGRTDYEYDSRHRVVRVINPLGDVTEFAYNEADEIIQARNAKGDVQTYEYDACGNLVRAVDCAGGVTEVSYNAMNQPVKITNPENQSVSVEYDTMWNPVRQTAADGGVTEYEYDRLHRLVKVTDPVGAVNRFAYDACGNMTQRTAPDGGIHKIAYDVLNRPNQVTDPCGQVVKAEYDAMGNVTKVLYEDGAYEEYQYDLGGNIIYSRDRGGYRKSYTYDAGGNLLCIADEEVCLEEYTYYPGGLMKSEKHADGSSRYFEYDANENLVQITNQDGNSWHFIYDSLERIVHCSQDDGISESYEYDALDNIIAVTDGEGNKTVYEYSPCGEVVSVTDALGNSTYFQYDACQRMVGMIQSEDGRLDIAGVNRFNREQKNLRITSYERDKAGNVIRAVDPEGIETLYTYDGCGRILSQKDGDGNLTVCAYNPDGTEKEYTFADGRFVKYQYNALKQLIQMEDWLGVTKIENDAMGRVKKVTYPGGEQASYEWGVRGELKSILYPDQKKVQYRYDKTLRLASFMTADEEVSYSYYGNGRLKEKDYRNGFCTAYEYDALGRISEICHRQGDGVLDRINYQYDKRDRKSRIIRERTGIDGSGVYDYRYTALGCLALVIKDGVEEERYSYDNFGNRIRATVRGEEQEYTYNRLNQLISMKNRGGEHLYTYDGRGNMVREELNGNPIMELEFGALNLLSNVKAGNKRAEYIYDGFRNRVGKSIFTQGQKTDAAGYLYDITRDNHNLLCFRSQGSMAQSVDVMWDGGLLGLMSDQGSRFNLNDELMTPQRLVGRDGVLASAQYDSFGNLTGGTNPEEIVFGYTGYQRGDIGGMYYASQRQYAPASGRFLSIDPFPGLLLIPLTLNGYAYCMSDPMNYIDPSGQIVGWLAGGIVGAAAKVAGKVAGDVVKSVKSGKIQVSSWQSYVGAASGGFTSGAVYVASGGNGKLASAAGDATETLVTGGLSMATGAKGYRKEDGYSFGKLLGDTATSAVKGLTTEYAFGKVGKYVKIPGINKGRGSCEAVWKQVMTKCAKGQIANVSAKTIGKGLIAYGATKTVDEIIKKGVGEVKDTIKTNLVDFGKQIFERVKRNMNPKTTVNVVENKQYMSANRGSAVCPAGA